MRVILVTLTRLGAMQAVMALTSLVRIKVIALELGASGLGDFAQLFLLATTVAVVVSFGLDLGLNRNIASAPDQATKQTLLNQANTTNLTLSVLCLGSIFAVLLLRPGTTELLGVADTPVIFASLAIMLLAAPLDAAVRHRVALLTVSLDIKGMTYSRSIALVAATVLSVPIVVYFGLVGAAVQVALVHGLTVLALDRRCRRIGYRPWGLAANWSVFRALAVFGVSALIYNFSQQTADLFVRAELIRSFDAAQNGYYQAAMSILNQLGAIILGSVGSYAIARMSADTSRESITEIADGLISVVIPVSAVAFAGIGLLSGPAIIILFSSELLPAQSLMPLMLTGEFMLVAIWVLGASLLARKRIATWLTLGILSVAVRTIAALLLMPRFGVDGLAAAYLIGMAFHLVSNLWLFVSSGFGLSRRSIILLVSGLALIAGASYAGSRVVFDWGVYAVGVTVIAAYAAACVQLVFGIPAAWAMVRRGVLRRQES